MARLPSSDVLGQRPTPQSGRPIAGYDSSAVPRAVDDIGQVLKQQAQIAQRAQATLTMATLTNQLHDAHDEVARGLTDGSIAPGQALSELRTRSSKLTSDAMGGLNPQQRQLLEAHVVEANGTLERSLSGAVYKRQQSDMAGAIDNAGEQFSRDATRIGPKWASEKYSAFMDFAGNAAGLTPEAQQKLKQSFAERTHYAYFDTLGTDALTKGDSQGLRDLRAKVNGPEGEVMDPVKRAQLTHQLFGYEQHIEAKKQAAMNQAERDQLARENTAIDYHNKTVDLLVNGHQLSPEWIKEATTAAAGTEMAASLGNLLAGQSPLAGFATKPAADRAAILERFRNQAADPTKGTDPLQAAMVKQLTTVNDNLTAKYNENPWTTAQATGVIPDAPAFDVSDPSQLGQVLQRRMNDIAKVEAAAGHKVSPLQPGEADQVAKTLRTLPPDQAATLLTQIGGAVGESERISALSKQIHDKDGTLGLAMAYTNAQTTQGRNTAELILRGAQAEKDGTIKVDGTRETGWKAIIAKQIRGAFPNQEIEDNMIRAAYLIAGARDGDVDNAVRLATGGIMDFNGSKIPLPYGMTKDGQSSGESLFRDAIKAITPANFASQAPDGMVRAGGTSIPLEKFVKSLPDAQLVHAGQGIYNVRAGNIYVTNSAGRRLAVQVTP